jgi:hypothetical protein
MTIFYHNCKITILKEAFFFYFATTYLILSVVTLFSQSQSAGLVCTLAAVVSVTTMRLQYRTPNFSCLPGSQKWKKLFLICSVKVTLIHRIYAYYRYRSIITVSFYFLFIYLSSLTLDNVRSLTSHNPIGLQGLLRDSFTLTL